MKCILMWWCTDETRINLSYIWVKFEQNVWKVLESCLEQVIKIWVNWSKWDKWKFKAKEWDLLRCKNYMYRRKKSVRLDKV